VAGISTTEKRSRSTSATVRLAPSTAIEPLAASRRRNLSGGLIQIRRPVPVVSIPATLPTAST
jgi:hypothetical protein